MSARLFQYAKSGDAKVLAAVERNRDGRRDWQQRAYDFAQEHGAAGFYPTSFAGRWDVLAIDTEAEPKSGRWKRMRRGWAPYKNNPLAQEMAAIRFTSEQVPGLPALLHSAYDDQMRHYLMSPTPFLHDGTAWVGVAHVPVESDRGEEYGPEWSECFASEFYAAQEAVNAERKAEADA